MLIIAGVYLVIGGLIGVGMSVRSALAQARYAAILFGRQEPEAELLEARRSFRLDPHHYSMCIRAAETAFRAGETAADPERADAFMREAAYWVGRGLELNPWLIELRYLDACLRARESPVAGAAAWKAYVDWHFWNPDNLEHLARFLPGDEESHQGLQREFGELAQKLVDATRADVEARIKAFDTRAAQIIGNASKK